MRPSRSRWRITARIMASMSFMSTAPRPQTWGPVMSSAVISPEKGCTAQSAGSAGTTSRWPCMTRAGRAGVLAGDPGDHARPAGVGFQDLWLQANFGEQRGNVLSCLTLSRAGVIAAVAGIDPDQVAAQCRDLIFGGDRRGGRVLSHLPIVALGQVRRMSSLGPWRKRTGLAGDGMGGPGERAR